jgi:hypothetical protein
MREAMVNIGLILTDNADKNPNISCPIFVRGCGLGDGGRGNCGGPNGSFSSLTAPRLSLGYLGLFLDNVRGWGCGRYRQLGRSELLKLGDLDLFFSNSVRYFEVCHVVSDVVLDGVVVVYTNVEDFSRFGSGCVRVEWRPPRNFVKRQGLGALRKGLLELVEAFRAIAVVLGRCLSLGELSKLYAWLSASWGLWPPG